MRKNNKRSDILEAALHVVDENGANHLTIDAVAAQAGFSKGGVLYHFASKKALLSGMLDYLIAANQQRVEKFNQTNNNENPLSAFLQVEDRMTEIEKRASLALVAAAAEDPELLEPARLYMKQVFEDITRHSDDPNLAITLFLANEGLRFLDIFELNPMSSKQSTDALKRLSAQAKKV